MSRTVTRTIYTYDELPTESAKERAREWYRERVFSYSCDWEFVYDDAVECAKILGIEIGERPYQTMGGKALYEPAIYFSLGYCQGDFASFEGSYAYATGCTQKIREHAPQDSELHGIADQLQEVQKRHFYRLEARIKDRRNSLDVEVFDRDNEYRDLGEDEMVFRDLMRRFAQWIYQQLRNEHEYQTSDEQVTESIQANGYEFEEDGSRANT